MGTDTFDEDLKSGITDEMMEEARDLIGTEMRTDERGLRRRHSWNSTATRDNIRHFTHGYGDDNPLYRSPEHVSHSRWDSMPAPPTWLWTVDSGIVAPKFPGIQWIHGGRSFEFERPITVDDQFTVSVKPTNVERKSGSTVKEFVIQQGEVKYFDQKDELVATQGTTTLRIPRTPSEGDNFSISQEREPANWSRDEIRELEGEILAQERRGNETRYWDTVSEGDALEPRIKGPLSLTDIVCWYAGWGTPMYHAHEAFVKERRRHPSEAFIRDNGIVEHPAMGHIDPEVAKGVGIPRAYDIGFQRETWLVQTVTDWMSDDGFVKSLDLNVEKLNYLGDVVWCKGEVEEVYVGDAEDPLFGDQEHLVDITLWGENQDGTRVAHGSATVQLPVS